MPRRKRMKHPRRRRAAWFVNSTMSCVLFVAGLVVYQGYQSTFAPPISPGVGALFLKVSGVSLKFPFCTATIVPSEQGNIILTAAHCLNKFTSGNMEFAPGFSNGNAPFGTYGVTAAYTIPGWRNDVTDDDFAFLKVNGDVQRKAGAEQIGSSSPVPSSVTLEAYGLTGEPVTCTRPPQVAGGQARQDLRFDCAGFYDGASGAPFLAGLKTSKDSGTIVGVLGGYQDGGKSSSESYASPFGTAVYNLWQKVKKQ
jgi:Trypsin